MNWKATRKFPFARNIISGSPSESKPDNFSVFTIVNGLLMLFLYGFSFVGLVVSQVRWAAVPMRPNVNHEPIFLLSSDPSIPFGELFRW
jgi:hypothetical protein